MTSRIVKVPAEPAEIDQVRDLMRAFTAWHRARHLEDAHLIDSYFDAKAYEEELASLPGKYLPPHGQLLLATLEGAAAGCVALRGIDAEACEMKRMYVHAHLHGNGVGRALGEAVINEAKRLGYRCMRLDTSVRQEEAQSLYRRLGFRQIEPYYDLTPELRNWLVFMERPL